MTSHPYKVLLLFAHPALQKSRVNRVLIREARQIAGVTFRDLYEVYPELDIDVRREQQLLAEHDIVVFQHPLFWYSTPAILKEWQDLVLEHGWAYGSGGTALLGKRFLSVITTGGRETAYRTDGYNRFTMRQLLVPIEQTVRLCGMEYLPPFIVHGTHRMTTAEMEQHATDYRRMLEALRDDRLDLDAADRLTRLNSDLDSLFTN